MSTTNITYNERERIIFMHDIEDDQRAIELSKKYPQLIIFTDPQNISDISEYLENETNVYGDDDFTIGAHIYKAGVRYSLVRGINPRYNKVVIGNDEIRLKLDKWGLLRLERIPITSGYVYIGPYNPIEAGFIKRTEGVNEYELSSNEMISEGVYKFTPMYFYYKEGKWNLNHPANIENADFIDNSSIIGIGKTGGEVDSYIENSTEITMNYGQNYYNSLTEMFAGNNYTSGEATVIDGVNGVAGFYRDFFITKEAVDCPCYYTDNNVLINKNSNTTFTGVAVTPTDTNSSNVQPYNVEMVPAYILMPKIFSKRIKISPTIFHTTDEHDNIINAKYVFEILQDSTVVNEYSDMVIDSVEYILIKTVPKCHKVRLYYINYV